MTGKVHHVFLSSTFLDQEERRRHILEAIERFPDMKCVAMERFTATTHPAKEFCCDLAARADLFIGILAYRYGWIPDGEHKSIVELEHDAAHDHGVDRLMFTIDPRRRPMVPDIDADPMPDRWDRQKLLESFKGRLSGTKITARPFVDDTELVSLVVHAVLAWREQRKLVPAASPTAIDPPALQQDEMRYRDALLAEHRHLRFVGFTSRQRAPMNLDELFVPMFAATNRAERIEKGRPDAQEGRDIELSHCLTHGLRAKRRGVVITGRPGAGKTTHLRRLAFGLLTQGESILGFEDRVPTQPSLLPVFIPLRRLDKTIVDQGLAAAIAHTLPEHAGLDLAFAKHLLARGHLVLMFDGLDEATADLRDSLSTWIRDCAKHCPSSYFLLTSRFAGYTERCRAAFADAVVELEIKPLDDKQIAQFVDRWYRLVEIASSDTDRAASEARGAAEAKKLLDRLAEPEMAHAKRVLEMTSNPLLLTIICLVHRDGSYLPDDVVHLYKEASQVLLEGWRRAKGLTVALTADEATTVLRPLAFHLHQTEGRTATTASDLVPVITPALRDIRWTRSAEDFLNAIRDESGILVGLGDDRFSFLHLGFQEYFAALDIHARVATHALDDPTRVSEIIADIASHFGTAWWREVLLILLKRAEPPHLFVPIFRHLARHDFTVLGVQDRLLDDCIKESAMLRAAPFAEALAALDAVEKPSAARRKSILACTRALLHIDGNAVAGLAAKLLQYGDKELTELLVTQSESHLEIRRALAARSQAICTHESRTARGGIRLLRMPGGRFEMGGTRHGNGQPPHPVDVPGFWLAATPVTNAQYRSFVEATNHPAPGSWKDPRFNAEDQPVVTVSWNDARAFCDWAGLRLPSEAEWEFACRAGTTSEYWFGEDESQLADHAWFDANSGGSTRPVGTKPANQLGLLDMHGNVWEWCEDKWHDHYRGAPTDGSAWIAGGSSLRVYRGGSWDDPADWCRSAYRYYWLPDIRSVILGFRPASSSLNDLTPSPPAAPQPHHEPLDKRRRRRQSP